MKQSGKRSAGKPHAAFDVAGAGNVMMVAGLRPMTKVMDKSPEPKVRAPVLDPTGGRGESGKTLLYPYIDGAISTSNQVIIK
jgi:hypothetical protein